MSNFIARRELTGYYVFDKTARGVAFVPADGIGGYGGIEINTAAYDAFGDGVPAELRDSIILAPNRVYLELTRRCQLNCPFCYNKSGRGDASEMPPAEFRDIVDQMRAAGVFELRFTGGEPTLSENLIPLLDYAAGKGCFYISLATNGVWADETSSRLFERVGVIDDYIVSLEGGREYHDGIRGAGNFDRTLRTVRELKRRGARKVRLNTVVTRASGERANLEALFGIAKENGLLLINFILPRPFGRGERLDLLDRESLEKIDILINELKEKWGVKTVMDIDLHSKGLLPKHPVISKIESCNAGKEFLFISPSGDVFPCSVSPVYGDNAGDRAKFVAGNVRSAPLLEIWHRSPVWTPFRYPELNKPRKCLECGYYGKKCFGSCPFGSYAEHGVLNGEDPYCWA